MTQPSPSCCPQIAGLAPLGLHGAAQIIEQVVDVLGGFHGSTAAP